MLLYYYYRFFKFKTEFEKDNKVDAFAEYNISATVDSTKKLGDRIRTRISELKDKRKNYSIKIDRIEHGGGVILEDDQYHTIKSKLTQLSLLLIFIFLAESGLNYFTSLIAIPITDETKGFAFFLIRLSVAFVITAIGIVSAERLFEEILPSKKYKQSETPTNKKSNLFLIILWTFGLIVTEYMIFHFGLARVEDIEGGNVNSETAKSLIVLSMIVPIVAGGIGWEISNFKDAYRNRRNDDKYSRCINKIDNEIVSMNAKENGFFQKQVLKYWNGFERIKSFKEYYNKKKGFENAELSEKQQFAVDYEHFYATALDRYNENKEKRDAISNLKINQNDVIRGQKIGQDIE